MSPWTSAWRMADRVGGRPAAATDTRLDRVDWCEADLTAEIHERVLFQDLDMSDSTGSAARFVDCTFAGMKHGFDARQSDLRVWTPDVFGSICFLVSSELAYAEVCHRWFCLRPRSLSWRIAALNLLGSIAFGVSAVTSLIEPSTQEPVSAAIANAGTAIGALCFLAGAVMLAPEAAQAQ